jgi:peptidoglycan/LPS O-acetylase OafA/YrhL
MAEQAKIPALDGLRGLACVIVVLHHADWIGFVGLYHSATPIAVMLFLTLSGFLMAQHYLPAPSSPRYWFGFLIRRFFRVYPLYALVVIVLWVLFQTSYIPYFDRFNHDVTLKGLLLYGNLSVLWTVPVEMKFYVVFALLGAWFATRFCKCDLSLLIMLWLALVIAALLGRRWFMAAGIDIAFLVRFDKQSVWPYLSYCLGGVIAARLYRTEWVKSSPPLIWNIIAALCLGILFTISANWLHPETFLPKRIWPHPIIFSTYTLIMVLSIAKATHPVSRLLDNRPMRFLGDISYSLYLTHFYIFVFGHYIPITPPALKCAVFISFAIAFAWVTYKVIEKPCHKYGIRLSNPFLQLK